MFKIGLLYELLWLQLMEIDVVFICRAVMIRLL
nr:MAG TPA: hypothetical protein [Bacteriophage sp.]